MIDGKLAPLPSSPNCVSTQAENEERRMNPIKFSGEAGIAITCLRDIIEAEPNTTVTEHDDTYLHAEFRSRIFRFVDDVELFADRDSSEIHFRSASRTGHSDFGVNKNRMKKICEQYVMRCSENPDKRTGTEALRRGKVNSRPV